MSELALKNRVLAMLKKEYPEAFVWKISDRWCAGVPDLLIINNGVHIFIELKYEKGKLSKIQEYTIEKINLAGGEAHICRTTDEVKYILNETYIRREVNQCNQR